MLNIISIGRWLATVLAVLLLTVYFGSAFDARRMPPLAPEHRIEFEQEFDAAQEDQTDWAAYLEIENRLAIELEEKIPSNSRSGSLADRYFADSLTFPENYPSNWNRSYEMSVPSPRGVAVLLHGLTDSPYTMLATAKTLAAAGYNIVAPRMPGHGFAVSGLVQARWEDWTAAVRIAIRRAMQRPGADQSLLIVGYSNGGLLAVDYALRCHDITELPCPDGLVLMSPGIAITRTAVVTNLHAAISWMSYFEQFKWLHILPEIDPFKFTSFPKRVPWEIHKFSKSVHKQLADPAKAATMPPVLTFQSLVDTTIRVKAIVTTLYDRLPPNGSELVIYDVNRNSTIMYLMKNRPGDPAQYFSSLAPLNFGVTILRNRDPSTNAIDLLSLPAGQIQTDNRTTTYSWPAQNYSLSHIAIPFGPDDMLYGDGTAGKENNPGIVFGALAPRGERGVLLLSSDYFLRARYNPFMEFQSEYLTEWLARLETSNK